VKLRPLVPAVLVGVVALGSLAPALAKSKRAPLKKSYSATLPVPHPLPAMGPACADNPGPQSEHRETLKVPAAGKLVVQATGFDGDFDLGLYDKTGNVAQGDGVSTGSGLPNTGKGVESLTAKIKKPGTYFLDVCNFAGTGTAHVNYTLTFS
jgi:hypothetical protein